MSGMTQQEAIRAKVTARDTAMKLMNRLTAGVVFGAVAGLGVLGYTAAATIPGSSSSKASTTTSSVSTSTSSSSSTGTSSSTSSSGSSLQSSSSSVSSSSSSGHAVSGGS
jgi:hypothetical protein